MKLGSKILLGAGVVLVGIQFIRPARNESAGPFPNDIAGHYETPEAVRTVLQDSCYDCHSDNTRYPWYFKVQPVAWWMDHHIHEAKRHLNFSQFATYSQKRGAHAMHEMREQVEEREMPIESYLLIHHDAKLTDGQIKLLSDWSKQVEAAIKQAPAN